MFDVDAVPKRWGMTTLQFFLSQIGTVQLSGRKGRTVLYVQILQGTDEKMGCWASCCWAGSSKELLGRTVHYFRSRVQ